MSNLRIKAYQTIKIALCTNRLNLCSCGTKKKRKKIPFQNTASNKLIDYMRTKKNTAQKRIKNEIIVDSPFFFAAQ